VEGSDYNSQFAWKALKVFGYRTDLVLETDVVPNVATLDSFDPVGPLPKHVVDLFRDVQFFDAGFKHGDAACLAILKKIVSCNTEMSNYYMIDCLERIFNSIEARSHSTLYDSFVGIIKQLLQLDDGLFEARVATLMTSSYGLCTVMLGSKNQQSTNSVQPAYNQYAYTAGPTFILDTYTDLGKQFYAVCRIARWVDKVASAESSVHFFRSRVNPNNRVVPSQEEIDGINRIRITVSGAADPAINGYYTHSAGGRSGSGYGHGPCFQKYTDVNGVVNRYTLYRWFMRAGSYNWFISLTPPGIEHSRPYSEDYYPPKSNWKDAQLNTTTDLNVVWELMDEDQTQSQEVSFYNIDGNSFLDDSIDSGINISGVDGLGLETFDDHFSRSSNSATPGNADSDSDIEYPSNFTGMHEIG
jgi:hypothetical protein